MTDNIQDAFHSTVKFKQDLCLPYLDRVCMSTVKVRSLKIVTLRYFKTPFPTHYSPVNAQGSLGCCCFMKSTTKKSQVPWFLSWKRRAKCASLQILSIFKFLCVHVTLDPIVHKQTNKQTNISGQHFLRMLRKCLLEANLMSFLLFDSGECVHGIPKQYADCTQKPCKGS